MLNLTQLQGRIPFDFEVKGDDGNEFVMFSISVARDYKPEGSQYYPEDLITCKAFKSTAKFLGANFAKGSHLTIVGTTRRDDDYEKEGQQVKGQMYVLVEKVYFAPKSSDNGDGAAKASQSKRPTTTQAAATTGKSANPLAGGNKKPSTTKSPF